MNIDNQQLLDAALAAGAHKAAIIDASQIAMSATFRDICASNSCGNYGKCWMCPPDAGDIETLMAKVRGYSHGVLYQTIAQLEDSFDIEGMYAAGKEHALVSQRVRDLTAPLLPSDALNLSCGGCRLCEKCAKRDNEPCRHPDKALSSLEGYGIDVYNTTKDTDLKYINGQNTVTYFGIVLFNAE